MTDPLTIIAREAAPNLAVDVVPSVIEGTFSVDVSVLDDPELLGWGGDPDAWVNIVCDVTRLSVRRGATRLQGPLTRAEAGTATVEVLDAARRFDPLVNADAIHAGTPLRLRAWGETWEAVLFTGSLDDIPVSYARTGPPQVTLTASDLIARAAEWQAPALDVEVGAGDDLLERVQRLLVDTGLGGAVTSSTTTYTPTAQPTPPATQAAELIRARLAAGLAVFGNWTWTGAPALVVTWHDWLRQMRGRPPEVWLAARYILDRYEAGASIFEDWSWHGYPPEVARNNDTLVTQAYAAIGASYTTPASAIAWLTDYLRDNVEAWLTGYVAATTPPPAGAPVTVTTISGIERLSADVDTVYTATLGSTGESSAWGDMSDAADAELGRVWVDRDDRLVVRGRESQLSGPVRGTLSDWHGEGAGEFEPHCCYDDLAATLGTESLVNRAVAARRDPAGDPAGAVVQRDDTYSQALHRVRTVENRQLLVATDDQLAPWAESLVVTGSRPELRVDAVSPAPWGAGDEAWQAVLSTDLGDRWVLRYHPEQGPTVMSTVGVLGVEHEVTPDEWSIKWTTTEAPTPGEDNPTGWFIVAGSDVDAGDLLAPFGGAVPAPPP